MIVNNRFLIHHLPPIYIITTINRGVNRTTNLVIAFSGQNNYTEHMKKVAIILLSTTLLFAQTVPAKTDSVAHTARTYELNHISADYAGDYIVPGDGVSYSPDKITIYDGQNFSSGDTTATTGYVGFAISDYDYSHVADSAKANPAFTSNTIKTGTLTQTQSETGETVTDSSQLVDTTFLTGFSATGDYVYVLSNTNKPTTYTLSIVGQSDEPVTYTYMVENYKCTVYEYTHPINYNISNPIGDYGQSLSGEVIFDSSSSSESSYVTSDEYSLHIASPSLEGYHFVKWTSNAYPAGTESDYTIKDSDRDSKGGSALNIPATNPYLKSGGTTLKPVFISGKTLTIDATAYGQYPKATVGNSSKYIAEINGSANDFDLSFTPDEIASLLNVTYKNHYIDGWYYRTGDDLTTQTHEYYGLNNIDTYDMDQNGIINSYDKASPYSYTGKDGKDNLVISPIWKPAVLSVTLNYSKISLEKGDVSVLRTTSIKPADIDTLISWKSSNSSIVKVGQNGRIVAKKNGTATITCIATDGGRNSVTAKCTVTVKTPVTKVKLSKKTLKLAAGKTYALKATVYPSTASKKKVTWESTNTSIAIVSSAGLVKAKKKGRCTITATSASGNKRSKCKVNVY